MEFLYYFLKFTKILPSKSEIFKQNKSVLFRFHPVYEWNLIKINFQDKFDRTLSQQKNKQSQWSQNKWKA